MADWDDVVRVAKALAGAEPSTTWGNPCWKVRGKSFAWQRPLTKKDRADLGDAAPDGQVLAVRVEDLGEKEAILATPGPWFTTPHFDGYPAVLVDLDEATPEQVHELVLDAWRAMAPADQPAGGRFED
ncbi:MmcQ/YjbR family DNA-binding protein [Pseudactinotalea terrae]|uniref:MmcQ/YjbR family DNA-binding protein n=1 Tax=Pseudactinotalea terrae TaxID=1743262 RepID=UPI0012E31E95|nr:MmcQ/YjbR family DNA-binding protein [Pseudactinotalea terrae]